jgi:hypothetical protein
VILTRRADLKISQQALRFEIMTTMLAVELAYDDLIDAREEIIVQEKALKVRREFVAETQAPRPGRRVAAAGRRAGPNRTAKHPDRAGRRARGFAARQNTLMGLLTDNFKEWADVTCNQRTRLQALPVEVNRSRSFQSALTNRPDLIEARLAVQKSGVMVKFRLNQLFPSLDMVGGYGTVLGNPTGSSPFLSDVFAFRTAFSFPIRNILTAWCSVSRWTTSPSGATYRASKAAKKIAELQLRSGARRAVASGGLRQSRRVHVSARSVRRTRRESTPRRR